MLFGAVESPYAGWPRLVRGWAVGAAAVGISAAGHVLAGGPAPSAAVLVLLTVIATAPCAVLSRLEWTVRRLTGALLVAQGLLHLGFLATAHHHAGGNIAPMLGWHLLATLVTVAVIRHAEAVLATTRSRLPLRRAFWLFENTFRADRQHTRLPLPGTPPAVVTCRYESRVPARAPPLTSV